MTFLFSKKFENWSQATILPFKNQPASMQKMNNTVRAMILHRLHPHVRRLTSLAHLAPFPRRTHTCGELTAQDVDQTVILTGWLQSARQISKSLSFFTLRDPYGTTQLVTSKSSGTGQVLSNMANTPLESTVLIEGTVKLRPKKDQRPEPSGAIEIQVNQFTLLNPAEPKLPFYPIDIENLPNELARSRDRVLDLRRPSLASNIRQRSRVSHIIRNHLVEKGFTEVETPLLLKSSPEGAREYLVPARPSSSTAFERPAPTSSLEPGSPLSPTPTGPVFYALSQSPQQPKQLLICSGAIDKYFQFARCFRDEDGRKDRQPEFTQIDMEMGFISWGDREGPGADTEGPANGQWRIGGMEIRATIEDIIRQTWLEVKGVELPSRFKVMSYQEAMERYGSDKPDTRFGLEVQQFTSTLPAPARVYLKDQGLELEAVVLRASATDAESTALMAAEKLLIAQPSGGEMVDRLIITSEGPQLQASPENRELWHPSGMGPIGDELLANQVVNTLKLQPGDVVRFSTRKTVLDGGSTPLGKLRLQLIDLAQKNCGLKVPQTPHFLWVTEFPLFTHSDTDKDFMAKGRWSSSHHPFTAPMWQDMQKLKEGRFEEVRGQHYDLVLNGMEIAGGSVRVHDAKLQEHIFREVLQLTDEECATFDHLLYALKCGAPPHGGIAIGFDRLMSILCDAKSIRDVIAFPKTAGGVDPVFKSPSRVADEVLQMYNLKSI